MKLVFGALIATVVTIALGYWIIVITEGAYLGRRLVTYLYDRGADTYDEVKEFDITEDAWFLGIPLMRDLEGVRHPLVLDVATGTGRMALSLLRQLTFDGAIIGVDLSQEMLQIAQTKTKRYSRRITLLRKDATRLPFADNTFDAVTCVEALEFLPDPNRALAEMVRVLRPGGTLLVTNRIGWERYFLPGRAFHPQKFEERLAELGLIEILTKPWQTYYDLIWARKPGSLVDREAVPALQQILQCPHCGKRAWHRDENRLQCFACHAQFSKINGFWDLERDEGPWQRELVS